MPGYDRTGPCGRGSMTGRGFGPCGQGAGFGRGCRRGYRFWQRPVDLTKEEKVKILKAEKEDIEKALKELEE